MKVAIYSTHKFEKQYLKNASQKKHKLVFIEEELTENNVNLAKSCDAISLFTSDNASAIVLNKLAKLGIKNIALRSVGYDHVDLKVAKALNMNVANVPAYSPHAVAEHAVAMLLTLNRKITLSQKLIKKGDFRLDRLIGFDLNGKTVGIVGLGKIGEVFATIMSGFGCRIICFDPAPRHVLKKQLNITYVSFSELCQNSDIISIHCPLNKQTKHLFNKSTFALMKENVYLINTARGPIIKTDDLIKALEAKLLGGVALDVYEFEKGLFFHDFTNAKMKDATFKKLTAFENVLMTGHQGFLTATALQNIAETTIANLDCFGRNEHSSNSVLS